MFNNLKIENNKILMNYTKLTDNTSILDICQHKEVADWLDVSKREDVNNTKNLNELYKLINSKSIHDIKKIMAEIDLTNICCFSELNNELCKRGYSFPIISSVSGEDYYDKRLFEQFKERFWINI